MAKDKKSKKGKGAKKAKVAKPKINKPKAGFVKKKKKKWFEIIAPKEFNSKRIGETLANEPNELVGRKLRVNLMNLIDDFRRQGVSVHFKIASVTDNTAICKTTGYDLLRSHVRRLIRKGSSKMDDSFVVEAKDGIKFRIKPFVVSRHKLNDSSVSSIRKKTSEFFKAKMEEADSVDIFGAIVRGKLQRELRSNLMKICPIGACEIRALELLE
jgi:small subunit ribosomal protein S3Ae